MERYEYLIKRMWAELHDAKDYARAAHGCKEHSYADTMMELARQEYSHFSALHSLVEKMAATWESDHALHIVWKHDRQRLVEHAAHVKKIMEIG